MKRSRMLWGAALPLALMTSCAADDPMPVNQVVEADQTRYLSVSISSAGMGTRSADSSNDYTYDPTSNPSYEQGEIYESEVQNAYFVFFDGDGNYVASKGVVGSQLGKVNESYDANGNIRKSYEGVVAIDLVKGMAMPTKMMCFINPLQTANLNKSLIQLETDTRNTCVKTNEKNEITAFPMSNAVFYEDGGTEPVRAINIEGALFDSEQEANDALNATTTDDAATSSTNSSTGKVVDVYVERYAAKVKFSYGDITDNITLDVPTQDGVTAPSFEVHFVPEAWGVNATDKATYVSKNFRDKLAGGGVAGQNLSYEQINNFLNGTQGCLTGTPHLKWKWNAPENHRSYWGRSPSFFLSTYPEVSSDLNDGDENNAANFVNYLKPATMPKNFSESGDLIVAEGKDYALQYVMESTTGNTGLFESPNPAASVASIVIYGHYNLTKDGEDLGAQTFYIMRNSSNKNTIFFPNKTDGTSEVEGGQSLLSYFVNDNPGFYLRNLATNEYSDVTVQAAASFGTIQHPAPEVLGSTKLAARKVCYQLDASNSVTTNASADGTGTHFEFSTEDATYVLCMIDGNTGQYVEIGNGSYTLNGKTIERKKVLEANQMIVTYRGQQMAEAFTNGQAWYNIPIQHLGWYAGQNDNNGASEIDWSKVRVGDFGIVRNHVYHIDVTGINNLGVGILDPNDPILPPQETDTKAAAYKLYIENWALVPRQSVTL